MRLLSHCPLLKTLYSKVVEMLVIIKYFLVLVTSIVPGME